MKKYDYILVGSGLYSGVFAWFAKQKERSAWSWKRGIILAEMCTVKIQKVSMYTNTVPTFSIQATKKYGSL